MNTNTILLAMLLYSFILFMIAFFTARGATTSTFFNAENKAQWYWVAFGSVGTVISGFTFITVPGYVGTNDFSYIQRVFGFLLGYGLVGTVLLPVYYRYNTISIYSYLEQRFGFWSYKSGAFLFLLSRTVASAFMIYVAASVAHSYLFDDLGIHFGFSVFIVLTVIALYSLRGGIKTIVAADIFQTLVMFMAVGILAYLVIDKLGISFNDSMILIQESEFSQAFFWDTGDPRHFFRQFFAGVFIAIVMNGLDQDIMQKNLSCPNLADAQKNMFWFGSVLVVFNIALLTLGALLYLYGQKVGIPIGDSGNEFYILVLKEHLGPFAGLVFLIGLIAATSSSADSSMVALTTSFCVDFLDFAKTKTGEARKRMIRIQAQLIIAMTLFLLVLLFRALKNETVVDSIYTMAGYTYGPLLGLFAFGLLTKWKVKDHFVPIICAASPVISYLMDFFSVQWFDGYQIGSNLLVINGLMTFIGMLLLVRTGKKDKAALS